MDKLIEFLGKYLGELKPFDFFLILAIILLSIPYIYNFFRKLFEDRLKSSLHLIKIKEEIIKTRESQVHNLKEEMDEIINKQRKGLEVLNQELESSNNEVDKRNYKLKEIAKIIRSLKNGMDRHSELNNLIQQITYSKMNLALETVGVMLTDLSYISNLKSMVLLYSNLNPKDMYPEAPNPLAILDSINEIESKITDFLPKEVSVELILKEDVKNSKWLVRNFELEFMQLNELESIMTGYIDKLNGNDSGAVQGSL